MNFDSYVRRELSGDIAYATQEEALRQGGLSFPVQPEDLARWAVRSLDLADEGVALVDGHGLLRFANRGALEILEACNVLAVENGRLTAHGEADRTVLRSGLDAVATRGLFRLIKIGYDEAPKFLALSPIGKCSKNNLVLCNFGRRFICNKLTLQWYAQLHDLTLAEGVVLQKLCDGAEPIDIAKLQNVALSTVRTQISAIRGKTGHGSIRHLLCALAAMPAIGDVGRHNRPAS